MLQYRRKRGDNKQIILLGLIVIIGVVFIFLLGRSLFSSNQGNVVHEFYKYEQKLDLTHSYDLFHPLMQEKFTREGYFRQRHHIFFEHFEVSTFHYKVSKGTKLKSWKMSEDSPVLENVYKFPVTITYESPRFGKFSIHQDAFVAKDKGKWKLLWEYR